LTSEKEQFYIQRISELEAQLKQRDERIAALEKQVAELLKVNAELVSYCSNHGHPPMLLCIITPKKNFLIGILCYA